MPNTASSLVHDLLQAVPHAGEGVLHGVERWRRFEVTAWNESWKAAALALGMFETSDFKSLANRWHDEDVKIGKATGPYVGNSRFRRWWSAPPVSEQTIVMSDIDPVFEAFDVWLVTRQDDAEVRALMVFERWAPLVRQVPELPMDARCKPTFTVPARVFGDAMFWVAPQERGHGLGRRLAESLVKAYHPIVQAAYLDTSALPFMVAVDRGARLLERIAPWPVVEQRTYNRGQRQSILNHERDSEDLWPEWRVERQHGASPKSRRRPRS